MGFEYDKIKKSSDAGSHWATYSDLFMVLSLVFLLLYVFTSLRSGTFGIASHIEVTNLRDTVADLKEQLKVYESLKDSYLEKEASREEQQVYDNLMSHLDLLQDEAKGERDELKKQAQALDEKEKALNQYQQIVRNIIQANVVAGSQITRRDQKLSVKEQQLQTKKQEISALESEVQKRQSELSKSEVRIQEINRDLERQIRETEELAQKKQLTELRMAERIAELKAKKAQELKALEVTKAQIQSELQEKSVALGEASLQLQKVQSKLTEEEKARQELTRRLEFEKQAFEAEQAKLNEGYQARLKEEREQFEANLKLEQVKASEARKRRAAFEAEVKAKEQELKSKVSALQGKIEEKSSALKEAQKKLNARKELATAIQAAFAKAGIAAQVDPRTGDVILSFGKEYFDTGKFNLKAGMQEVLKKFMPEYAKALFKNEKTAQKIKSVEIVGFASPTYAGRYVDPKSLRAEDRKAVNYNLDLSYFRAREIFKYVFDQNRLKFKHQDQLYSLVKVTGRSFLASNNMSRELSSEAMSDADFCAKYNCKEAQRVIIKFNLDD